MADNVTANAGAGGATFATDDIAGVHYPISKTAFGALDAVTLVSTSDGLPVAQQGTWNINNISGTISLPTGASTAAKQPALGTAGTASADVITVQGIAAMTPILATLSGTNNIATVTTLTSVTNAVTVAQATAANLNATVVGTGTFAVQAACTNAGTFAVQVDGNALTALQLIDDPVIQDDNAFTPATSKVMMSGFQADETATDSVDEGDAGAARMTLDRKVIVTPQPHTAGGLSIARDIDLDNSTLTVVKASAGQLYGWSITNTSTATVFVKFYDATSGTLGTGTPVMTIGIPGNATDDTILAQSFGGLGIVFGTGICVGAGTGVADADNTDPGANAVVANIYYK